jgi:hypothetical protein
MGLRGDSCGARAGFQAARGVLRSSASIGVGRMMSQRAHFWLRLLGLAVILAAELGPRLCTGTAGPQPARIASASAR